METKTYEYDNKMYKKGEYLKGYSNPCYLNSETVCGYEAIDIATSEINKKLIILIAESWQNNGLQQPAYRSYAAKIVTKDFYTKKIAMGSCAQEAGVSRRALIFVIDGYSVA